MLHDGKPRHLFQQLTDEFRGGRTLTAFGLRKSFFPILVEDFQSPATVQQPKPSLVWDVLKHCFYGFHAVTGSSWAFRLLLSGCRQES